MDRDERGFWPAGKVLFLAVSSACNNSSSCTVNAIHFPTRVLHFDLKTYWKRILGEVELGWRLDPCVIIGFGATTRSPSPSSSKG